MGIAAGTHRIGEHDVEVTSVDRVLFPDSGITKGDVVAHYRDVAAVLLPHVRGRPLTLQRFPSGIDEGGFYMKDVPDHFPDWIETVEVPRRGKGDSIHQAFLCDDPAALVYLANQGCVTFHVWPARADDLDHPDRIVFDLDPPDDVDPQDVLRALRDGARTVRDLLLEAGLTPYLQTTGSKGFHIVAPIDRTADFETVGAFADHAAEQVAEGDERFTTAFRKAKRGGRIFVDVRRNAYAQTYVAPYSIRPRAGAPVATPVDWGELGRVTPRRYTIDNIARRLGQKDDPWADMDEQAARLPER